ncbi:MAG: hypothetical protein KI790_13430, partial [Cyclobacteriaceae bacterium]|nr:hypothetical protein [Cyclobacteriaceae bacterium HetDA_MAG_MS6]
MKSFLKYLFLGLIALGTYSCASFYELNYDFNREFESGNLEAAGKSLSENRKALKRKTKFLYNANQGVVQFLLDKPELSNKFLEKAYLQGEDYQKNYADEAASFLTNPTVIDYRAEDHEQLLVLYYKILNYMKLKDYEAALVECRRMNIRLAQLSDKYKSDKKYKRDAFVHNLMGLIYEASGDYNNAFIAYRNAYDIYKSDYKDLFGLEVPDQLKQDLMRSAYMNGFIEELHFYERELNLTYKHRFSQNGELIFFWHNGLGPIKDEWSINFSLVRGGDGVVTFVNEDMGLNFPFVTEASNFNGDLTDLEFFRVAFPKYVERPPFYRQATLSLSDQNYDFHLVEDVNAIAFKVLNERMLGEMSKSLLRA